MDRLLVETDAPYLSPHPYRGKRNEPERVTLVLNKLQNYVVCHMKMYVVKLRKMLERLFKLK